MGPAVTVAEEFARDAEAGAWLVAAERLAGSVDAPPRKGTGRINGVDRAPGVTGAGAIGRITREDGAPVDGDGAGMLLRPEEDALATPADFGLLSGAPPELPLRPPGLLIPTLHDSEFIHYYPYDYSSVQQQRPYPILGGTTYFRIRKSIYTIIGSFLTSG